MDDYVKTMYELSFPCHLMVARIPHSEIYSRTLQEMVKLTLSTVASDGGVSHGVVVSGQETNYFSVIYLKIELQIEC